MSSEKLPKLSLHRLRYQFPCSMPQHLRQCVLCSLWTSKLNHSILHIGVSFAAFIITTADYAACSLSGSSFFGAAD